MRMTIARCAGFAIALLAATACNDATGPETLDETLLQEAALIAADATLEDVGMMGRQFAFGVSSGPGFGGGRPGGGQPGRPGGQHGIGSALSGTRDFTFYDTADVVMDAFDELATARIEVFIEVGGEISRTDWSASIARSRTMAISGLEGENTTRIFNGSGTEEVSRRRTLESGEVAAHDMTGSFTYHDLVVPTSDQEIRYPLSGTIERLMTVVAVNGRHGDATRTFEITITFDGDDTATGTIAGETFEIDLTALPGQSPMRRGLGHRPGG